MAAGRTFSSCLQARATHAILMSPSRNPQPNKASCTLPDFKGWTTDALIATLLRFGCVHYEGPLCEITIGDDFGFEFEDAINVPTTMRQLPK